ncbi:iron-siderophore ABC transporter substrate-binding protein [Paenibacillus sp. SC116]|uniref:ABC transporter substrate-binding protein n=1 Tax=Paenibacillus sp. SC116 TaxID=2968986 RepID=UPI00215B48B8|nr:iron-siderophore ABC transporter substrate-binding protein [Paenibacillus sp. SC116]MCR8842085.1 iron-siderophore ABC transporter substrate-binding protein [Paenibacillus sp. SC116]
MFKLGKKSLLVLASMVLLVSIIAGCGSNGQAGTTSDSSKPAAENQAQGTNNAQTSEAETVRVIEHPLGKTDIKGTPKRVVTLYQGATDVVVALGVKPVGVVEAWGEKKVFDYLAADLQGVPLLGLETQPNLEEIHKLKPDLIIASKFRHEEIYDQLSAIAPTVSTEVLYDWKATLKVASQALNIEEQGNKLLADWDSRVADFKQKMGDRLPIEASIINFRADHVRIYYMGYAGTILKELGFTRPPGHDADTWGIEITSKESIPDMNADVIFNFNYAGKDAEANKKTADEWMSHPLWKNIDAVKNNQVYEVNDIIWNIAGGYKSAHMLLDGLYDTFKLQK